MNKYLIILAAMLLAFTSCKKYEGDYFDPSVTGIYFESVGSGEEEMTGKRNFADFFLVDSTKLVVRVKVIMLGYLSDQDRTAVIKSKVFEKLPMADIEFPSKIVIPAGRASIIIPVVVTRPTQRQAKFGATLYIDTHDADSDFDEGVDGLNEFHVVSEETFTEPISWQSAAKPYFGAWSVDKHIFMLKVSKKQGFAEESSKFKEYNRKAVDSLRRYYALTPADPASVDIPFYVETDPAEMNFDKPYYRKPYYWTNEHDQYLGFNFDPYAWPFVSLWSHAYFSRAYDVTTADEAEFYEPTEANLKLLNKQAVELMFDLYNQFYSNKINPFDTYGSAYYTYFYSTVMRSDVTYELVKPAQWSGTSAALIDHYYGEYSEAKYRFMVKTLFEKDGGKVYLPKYFPVKMNAENEPEYCQMPIPYEYPPKYYPAWQDMKKYNVFFREKLAESGETGFTFPDSPVDPEEPEEPEGPTEPEDPKK